MGNIGDDIKEILINKSAIKKKVKQIGKKISKDYEGKELMLVGILKGSVPFMADLLREITIPCSMDFMAVSSYGSSTKSSGVVRIFYSFFIQKLFRQCNFEVFRQISEIISLDCLKLR